jgi:YjbE family integral membrane protein
MLSQYLGADGGAAILAFFQVVLIDVSLAGDNAIAVGLAASALPQHLRRKAIMVGLAGAMLMRIGFALIAVQMLKVVGLLLAGGILLLWVSWKIWQELRAGHAQDVQTGDAALHDEAPTGKTAKPKSFLTALLQILIADISMSLDNVLAVAGAAREHPAVLVFGLLLSIILMGMAATYVAKLLHKHPWVGYIGLAIVLFVSLKMIWEGHRQVVVRTNETGAYNQLMPDWLDIRPPEMAEHLRGA